MRMAYLAKSQLSYVSSTSIYSWFAGLAHMITVWHKRACQREALRRLDDYYLRDIGLTRQEVLVETAKPFWRA